MSATPLVTRIFIFLIAVLFSHTPAWTVTTPSGTLLTFTAEAVCDGKTTTASAYVVVVKPPIVHKFRYAPSAASIATYKGTYVSYVLGDIRYSGILLANGQVFDGINPITPDRW